MDWDKQTRRDVLRKGGQVAAASAVASTAGCTSSLPFVGGWTYQNWLHSPGEVQNQREHYGFFFTQPKAILEKKDNLNDEYVERYEDSGPITDLTGIDTEDMTDILSWSSFVVIKGDYEEADMTADLEKDDFEEDSEYSGYTIYVNKTEGSEYNGVGFGVAGGHFVVTGADGPDAAVDQLETVIDAKTGDESRYVEDSDAMKVLIDKLGREEEVSGRTFEEVEDAQPEGGRFSGQVGAGSSTQINGSKSQLRRVFVFEDNDAATDANVDAWVDARENSEDIWSEADNINTDVSGKAVVLKGEVDSRKLRQQ